MRTRTWAVLLWAVACDAPVYVPREPFPAPIDTGVTPPTTTTGTTGPTGTTTGTPTGATTGTTPPTASGLPCSLNSDVPDHLDVDNISGQDLDFYWLDFACNEWFLRTVPAGTSTSENTYITHTFLFRDVNGTLRGSITMDGSGSQVLEPM